MAHTATFDDVWKMFQEMVRENRQRNAELDQKFQETELRFKDTELRFKDTERMVKEVSRQIGQLGSRWGEFVEGLVAPACERLFRERGIPVHQVSQRIKATLPGNRHLEVDLLVVNGDTVIPVEVKSRLRAEDVRDFLGRLAQLKAFLPQFADRKVMGAVAGIVIEEGVDHFARNEGLFVIIQSGDTVRLDNPPEFTPRVW